MPRSVLLDTGFLVALVNASDPDHEACAAVARELRARVVSVEGVMVEAAHLLGRARAGAAPGIELALALDTVWVAPSEARFRSAMTLMARYADVPMDLVDALLVVTALEEGTTEVLTLDRRGFATYRAGKKRFTILP